MHEDGFEAILFKQISIGSNLEYETRLYKFLDFSSCCFSLPFVSYSLDFFERIQNQMQVFKEVFFSKFRPLFFWVVMPFIHRKCPRKHAHFKVFQLELHPRIFFFVSANSCRICFPCWHCSLHGRALEVLAGGRRCREELKDNNFFGSFGAMVKTWL